MSVPVKIESIVIVGVVVGGRARAYIELPKRSTGAVYVGGRATLTKLENWVTPLGRITFEIDMRPEYNLPYEPVDVEFALSLVPETEPQQTFMIDLEFPVQVRFGEWYVGPGSGIRSDFEEPMLSKLREGDRFPTLFTQAGVDGVTGISHVISRSIDSSEDEQSVSIQPVIPDDPRNVASNRRGEDVVIRPPERGSLTRQVARDRRDRFIDALRRRRRER